MLLALVLLTLFPSQRGLLDNLAGHFDTTARGANHQAKQTPNESAASLADDCLCQATAWLQSLRHPSAIQHASQAAPKFRICHA